MMRKVTRAGALLLSMSMAAAACDSPPPPKPPAPAAPAPDAPIPAMEAPAEAEAEDAPEIAYAYSPVGKRDPFRSIFDEVEKGPKEEVKTELQTFEVDQLKLVAIVTGRATPYAMVEDPRTKGHTITRGTLIGKNWGRVSAINPDCVVIKEEYRDYTGRKVTNTISMCLPLPEAIKLD